MKRKSVKKNKLLHAGLAIFAIFLGVSIYLLFKNGSGPLAFVTNPLLMAPLDEGNSMYNASTKTLTTKNNNGSVTVTKTSTQTDMSEARNGTGKAVVNKVVTTTEVDSNRNLVSTTNKISSTAVEANGDPDPTQNVTTVDRTVTFVPGIIVPSNSDLSNSDLTNVLKVKENVASTTIKSVTTDANGLVINEKSQVFGANEIAKLTATGVAGSKTCATNGSPVLEGTWVATGESYTDPVTGNKDTTQRQCVKCGSDGRYGNSSSCSQIFISGAPMVLPTGGGVAYTGKDIPIKPCFIKKDVGFVQVGTGHIEGDTVCNTNGVMTKFDDAKADMDKYCGVIKSGDVYKNGKCQPLVDQKTLDAEAKYKADEAKAKAAAQAAADAKAKAAAETARLAEAYKDSNCGGKFNNKTEKCVPIVGSSQSASGQKYAIVSINSGITAVSYVSGAPSSALTKATNSTILNTTYSKGSDCDAVLKSMGTGYSCEPIAGGNYYKVQKTYLNYVFGSGNSNSNNSASNSSGEMQVIKYTNSGESIAKCKELQKQYSGGECREQGRQDGQYVVNFVPPVNQSASTGQADRNITRKVDKATDCNPETEKVQATGGGGIYCLPKTTSKGSLLAGDTCETGGNSACNSGDCRNIENPNGDGRGWYCMSDQNKSERTIWDNPWVKYNGITTIPAYAIQSVRGIFWTTEGTLPLGAFCFGQDTGCQTGYCASNRLFDTCEINPFNSTSNVVTPPRETILSDSQKSKLHNVDQEWTSNNPMTVDNKSDCPEGSRITENYSAANLSTIYKCFPN